jgi:hypothetical protein
MSVPDHVELGPGGGDRGPGCGAWCVTGAGGELRGVQDAVLVGGHLA